MAPWSRSGLKKKKQEPEPLCNKSREIGCIFYRAGEPKPGVFVSLEPEPPEKKPGAGAASKKSQEPEPLKK